MIETKEYYVQELRKLDQDMIITDILSQKQDLVRLGDFLKERGGRVGFYGAPALKRILETHRPSAANSRSL
jgi:hypothetical protein